jgi:ABC-type polysaccharide/polyol phosphate transport system ATPase subunit
LSDVAIAATGLTKVYRLYDRPRHRLLDVFGLLPTGSSGYREHKALDGVTLSIARGEKVAVIGRNGAGKSTFMKLVSRVVQPTSGQLEVSGQIHALLQMGTGFHPDFTGRQNVFAYLAQIGVDGAEARRLFTDVVEFSELEEYIDQPVKTYSTGMAVRLMFSTSTAIKPDLLVLDEVLGVGDAYFTQKSFERIRGLCDRDGATLLLVTHDVYTASRLCDRMIWLDRGMVMIDDAPGTVIRSYEDSIRQQEEQRLRTKRLASIAQTREASGTDQFLVEIRARDNRPQPCPVYFSRIAAACGGRIIAELPLITESDSVGSALQLEATAWGNPVTWHGEAARPMLNYGSVFHKIAGVLARTSLECRHAAPVLRLRYWMDEPCDLLVDCYRDGDAFALGPLPPITGQWATHEIECSQSLLPQASVPAVGAIGAGDVVVRDVRFVDRHATVRDILEHGQPARLEVSYEILNSSLVEDVQLVLALQKDGVQDVCRFFGRRVPLDAARRRGTFVLEIPRLDVTDGLYAVTVLVARPGYYDEVQTTFYSMNPGVYCCWSRVFEVRVVGAGSIGIGTVSVREGNWSVR